MRDAGPESTVSQSPLDTFGSNFGIAVDAKKPAPTDISQAVGYPRIGFPLANGAQARRLKSIVFVETGDILMLRRVPV